MANSYVPANDGERATCIGTLDRIAATPGLPIVLAVTLTQQLAPARDAYERARLDNDAATVAVEVASDERLAAEALFAEAFDAWLRSAIYASGEAVVLRDLKPVLGNLSPSRFVRLAVRERIERMQPFDLHVRGRAHLTGDIARLDALKAATAALEAAVSEHEASLQHRKVTVTARTAAAAAFDRAYTSVRRALREMRADLYALLPTFHRTTAERTAAAAPAAAAPAPVEVAPAPGVPAEPEPATEPEPALTLVKAA